MNFKKQISSLDLPKDSYVVVGSGVLSALNIRKTSDIDLVVSDQVYAELSKKGWKIDQWKDQQVLKQGVFDVGTSWAGKNVDKLLQTATIIDYVPYLSLEDLREWKVQQARDKDLQDIKLIDEYLKTRV